MNEFFLIAGMAAITFSIRYAMFAVHEKFMFPQVMRQLLRYVPAAVLSAIVLPAVLFPKGASFDLNAASPYIFGSMTALVVGIAFRNVLLVIVTGMSAFLAWQNGLFNALLSFLSK